MAKFAAGGKRTGKKDLGLMAMSYGNVYVASIAFGANDQQTIKAFQEAEKFPGPAIIIAYSHCIAHGYKFELGLRQQKLAVDSGHWMLYRYNPENRKEGKNPLQLDSKEPKIAMEEFFKSEDRYKILAKADPETAARLLNEAKENARIQWNLYQKLSEAMPPA